MLQYLKNEANLTHTENGAVTYQSTQSECLDLFATIGAIRRESDEEITNRFLRAYAENADLAMKTLFFARDIRGGIGERRVFRTILKWLAHNEPQSVEKNIPYIAEYGRYDDLLALMGTKCEREALAYIKKQLEADCKAVEAGESVSLLAKWLPSVNASNDDAIRHAKHIARALGMNDAQYRKTLSALRAKISIIENNLREKDYTFDYVKQPSKAMLKYPQIKKAYAVATCEECVRGSDVVNSATSGKSLPYINGEWIKKGAYVSLPAGIVMDQEYVLRDDILRVVDNWGMYEAWSEELTYPWHDSIELIGAYYLDWIKEGTMKRDQLCNLGEIVNGHRPGRTSDDQIVIFGQGGLPIYDVAWGKQCYDKAVEMGLGVKLNLWDEPYMH